MIKTKNLFMLFTVLFVILFMCSYSFADFVVGLDGIKVPQDIIEAQGAGFNAVTVSPDSPIQDLSDKVIKSGLSICVPDTQCKKINLVNDKKILKKDSLRFLSYDAIIDGTTMLLYTSFYLEGKAIYENVKDWENIVDVISEISFVAEIINRGNKISDPFEINAPLKSASYEYGGIKYTFVVNPTEKRQTIPTQFYQQNFDVVGEKSSTLKKIVRNSKNNFKPKTAFVFRYE